MLVAYTVHRRRDKRSFRDPTQRLSRVFSVVETSGETGWVHTFLNEPFKITERIIMKCCHGANVC